MVQEISFTTTKTEAILCRKIAQRANALSRKLGGEPYAVLDAHMDIVAVHANGCPLKLNDLLESDDFNFAHDVFGIGRHLNRETGQLEDCFLPRFAVAEG